MSYINEFSKFTAIRKRFKQASDYNAFMRDLYKLYNATLENYKFLDLSEDKWFNLFKNALARNLDNLCEEALVDHIRPIIQEYINRQVNEQNPRIFNNLISLISQEVRVAREILKRFFRKLENLNINITPEFYEFLKEKCYTLKKYLEVLGIYDMSLKEVKKFLNRERTIYDDFRNRNYSYKENAELLDYVLKCLNDRKFISDHNKGIKTDNHRKVRYFIDNYPYFLEIHSVIKERYDVNDKTIDVAILGCSYAMLEVIIDSYRRYKVMHQDTSFMDLIVGKFHARPRNNKKTQGIVQKISNSQSSIIIDIPKNSKPANVYKKVSQPKCETSQINGKKESNPHKENKRYEFFKLLDGMSEDERKRRVDIIFQEISEENQKLFDEFVNGKVSFDVVKYIIDSLRSRYDSFENNNDVNNDKSQNDLTEYFPLKDGINEQERDEIINVLVGKQNIDNQKLIQDFRDGKIAIEAVKSIIRSMQRSYNLYGKEWLKPDFNPRKKSRKRKPIVEHFPVQEGMTIEERDEIVKIMVSRLLLEEQQMIQNFVDGKCLFDDIGKIIAKMLNRYNRHGKSLLSGNFEFETKEINGTLFDYFPTQEGMSEDERNRIVWVLYASLDKSKRDELSLYFDDNLKRTDKPINDIFYIVIGMQKKYKNYGKFLLVPYFLEIKDYYEFCKLVGIKKEINPEEKERKINDFLDDYLQNVINYIKYEFNVQLAPVDEDKKKVLLDALKVIEYIYRDKRGLSKYEYQSYFYIRILEIFMDKPQDLENLIISFINIEYELVRCFERKV